MKPANSKARALLAKLEELAERGIDGEKASARRKLARLKARFDFTAPAPPETGDLFAGFKFNRSSVARKIHSFNGGEFDIANCVKWAIESAAKIPCIYRNGDLLAEAAPATANKLAGIAVHIAESFRALLRQFGTVDGVNVSDRNVFVMGLYDGMMNERREVGQRLPNRLRLEKVRRAKKKAVAHAPGLNIHPYTIGLDLGRQIRFSAPLGQITAELEATIQRHLPNATGG
jgi:hypothetical protein